MDAGRVLSYHRKGHSQDGTGPGEFGPDYSDRKKYHLTGKRTPYPTHVIESYQEEKKMACDNIECNCEGSVSYTHLTLPTKA